MYSVEKRTWGYIIRDETGHMSAIDLANGNFQLLHNGVNSGIISKEELKSYLK